MPTRTRGPREIIRFAEEETGIPVSGHFEVALDLMDEGNGLAAAQRCSSDIQLEAGVQINESAYAGSLLCAGWTSTS